MFKNIWEGINMTENSKSVEHKQYQVKQVLKVDYRKTTHEINTGKKEL
jgi:hypothetical protein